MNLHETIAKLNALSTDVYKIRDQNGFIPHLTISYPVVEEVEKLVEYVTILLTGVQMEKYEHMSTIKISSLIALMSIPLKMESKTVLLDFVVRWATQTGVDEKTLAALIQSLRVTGISFNDVYAIRTAVFNYLTKPDINQQTTIKFLPTGKVEIHPREFVKFDGDGLKAHFFVLVKLQKLVTLNHQTTLVALNQYDFRIPGVSLPRSHQIRKRLSTYIVSGFRPENGKRWFASGFGKAAITDSSDSSDVENLYHYSALEGYRNSRKWASKSRDKYSTHDPEDSEEEEEVEEEEIDEEEDEREREKRYMELKLRESAKVKLNDSWNSSSSDEESEYDSGIHSLLSESHDCPSSSVDSSFVGSEPIPEISFKDPSKHVIGIPDYYNKIKSIISLTSDFALMILNQKFF